MRALHPRLVIPCICLLPLLACSDAGAGTNTDGGDETPGVERIEISPTSATVEVGTQQLFAARAYDASGSPLTADAWSWGSEDETVAGVDALGLATALSAGTTEIRASTSGVVAVAELTVLETPVPEFEECLSPQPGWIWCDDFESDRMDSYFESQSNDGSLVRAESVGLEGSWGLRARWNAGQVAAGNLKVAFGRTPDGYVAPVDAGLERYREIYWRIWVRYQPGWVGGGGDKLSRAMSLVTSNWSQAMIAHIWSAGDGHLQLAIDPASGTDEAGQITTNGYNDFDNLRWLGSARTGRLIFDTPELESWHCFEARVRLNDPGAANGLFELRIDGELEASRGGLNWVGSYDEYGINAVFLENYWNAGAPVAQERYLDGFIVSTEPIGC